jgi:hypothetical protein
MIDQAVFGLNRSNSSFTRSYCSGGCISAQGLFPNAGIGPIREGMFSPPRPAKPSWKQLALGLYRWLKQFAQEEKIRPPTLLGACLDERTAAPVRELPCAPSTAALGVSLSVRGRVVEGHEACGVCSKEPTSSRGVAAGAVRLPRGLGVASRSTYSANFGCTAFPEVRLGNLREVVRRRW